MPRCHEAVAPASFRKRAWPTKREEALAVDVPRIERCTFLRPAGIAQLVEHQLPKLRVAGSSPVSRFATQLAAFPLSQRPSNSPV